GDSLIGECYLRYVRGLPARAAATVGDGQGPGLGDAALSRERVVHRDTAEELLVRWGAGEPSVRRLFDRVRDWVVDGHAATYARLGVHVDRTLFESDFLAHAEALVQEG